MLNYYVSISLFIFQYGYRLPETDDNMLYYQVYFRPVGQILFTYPFRNLRWPGSTIHIIITMNGRALHQELPLAPVSSFVCLFFDCCHISPVLCAFQGYYVLRTCQISSQYWKPFCRMSNPRCQVYVARSLCWMSRWHDTLSLAS